MTTLFTLILAFIALGFCLYHRKSQIITLASMAVILVISTLMGGFSAFLLGLFILGSALIAIPSIRCALFSKPILTVFRRILPAMSQTEKEAIDAGTV